MRSWGTWTRNSKSIFAGRCVWFKMQNDVFRGDSGVCDSWVPVMATPRSCNSLIAQKLLKMSGSSSSSSSSRYTSSWVCMCQCGVKKKVFTYLTANHLFHKAKSYLTRFNNLEKLNAYLTALAAFQSLANRYFWRIPFLGKCHFLLLAHHHNHHQSNQQQRQY